MVENIPPPDGSRHNNHNTVAREVLLHQSVLWIVLTRQYFSSNVKVINENSMRPWQDFRVFDKTKSEVECRVWDGNWIPDERQGSGRLLYDEIVEQGKDGVMSGLSNFKPMVGTPGTIWTMYERISHASIEDIPISHEYSRCQCGELLGWDMTFKEGYNAAVELKCPKCGDITRWCGYKIEVLHTVDLKANGKTIGYIQFERKILNRPDSHIIRREQKSTAEALYSIYISTLKAKFSVKCEVPISDNIGLTEWPNPIAMMLHQFRKQNSREVATLTSTLRAILHTPLVAPAMQQKPVYPSNNGTKRRTNANVENAIKWLKGGNNTKIHAMDLKKFVGFGLDRSRIRSDQIIGNNLIKSGRLRKLGTNKPAAARKRLMMSYDESIPRQFEGEEPETTNSAMRSDDEKNIEHFLTEKVDDDGDIEMQEEEEGTVSETNSDHAQEFIGTGLHDTKWCRNPCRDQDLYAKLDSFLYLYDINGIWNGLKLLHDEYDGPKIDVAHFRRLCQNGKRESDIRIALLSAIDRACGQENIQEMICERKEKERIAEIERFQEKLKCAPTIKMHHRTRSVWKVSGRSRSRRKVQEQMRRKAMTKRMVKKKQK